jgi:hypothetical protein
MRFLGFGNGKDGVIALGSFTQTWYSCAGTSGAFSLSVTGTFVAGDRIFIHQSQSATVVGINEENAVVSYTPGTITLLYPLQATYTDSGVSQAQVAVVPQASKITGTYTVPAWDGNVNGLAYIDCVGGFFGTINANGGNGAAGINGAGGTGGGYRGGKGHSDANFNDGGAADAGEGYGAVASSSISPNANTSGGGGGQNENPGSTGAASGGGGGYATAGSNGVKTGGKEHLGIGGLAVGVADLTTLVFGGGGGGGYVDSAGSNSGGGGSGGGIIVVNSKFFDSTAQLSANGGNGADGVSLADGGGGAGGSILLRTAQATIGTNKITATGGTSPQSGTGAVGRIRIETCSLTGTTNPSASSVVGGFNYCGANIAML